MVGEAIRYVIPRHMQCSIGCGGQACKYDNPSYWRDDEQAIKGLYSSWYTFLFYISTCDSLKNSYNLINYILQCMYYIQCFFSFHFRVTDHLLAMSRPSTEIIEKYNIIDQFKR